MKILPANRIYDSLSFEVNKPESELLDILKSRTKGVAHFTAGDKILMMDRFDGTLFFDRIRLRVSYLLTWLKWLTGTPQKNI